MITKEGLDEAMKSVSPGGVQSTIADVSKKIQQQDNKVKEVKKVELAEDDVVIEITTTDMKKYPMCSFDGRILPLRKPVTIKRKLAERISNWSDNKGKKIFTVTIME